MSGSSDDREKPAGKRVDVEVDADILARIDALIPALSAVRRVKRADVLRAVIASGVSELEKQLAVKTPPGRPRGKAGGPGR